MPTLIRLFIFLLVIAGLIFGGMVALTVFVKPPDKEITINIPTRELVPQADDGGDPLGVRLPKPVAIVPKDASSEVPSVEPSAPADDASSGIKTLEPGAPE